MNTEQSIKKETEKWLLKIRAEIKGVKPSGKKGEEFLENIQAYIEDSGYFMEKGDLVRSFEAVIWAWAILETTKELGLLKTQKPNKGN